MFSLGYGEDDDKEGDMLTVPLGAGRLVSAVDEVRLVVVVVVVVALVLLGLVNASPFDTSSW